MRNIRFLRALTMTMVILLLMAGAPRKGLGDAAAAPTRAASYPRIAMLWSQADLPGRKHGEDIANWARHSVIVVGPEDLDLEWAAQKYSAMADTITPDSAQAARKKLDAIHKLNPHATVLIELYFFEANERDYPAASPWWQRDKTGQRTRFLPGCYNMDVANRDYVRHIANRIAAVFKAVDGKAGIFLDNLRFEADAKAGWKLLLGMVRKDCGDVPILVNAGWDSDDLAWVAPLVNGIMYEDSVAHTKDKNTEKFYARIAATDQLLRPPHISVNERFGPRNNAERMMRELPRTLVYTDMSFLYSDSTNGHNHAWWPQWDATLGQPKSPPVIPAAGTLARRDFDHGTVLWLPATAPESVKVDFNSPMLPAGENAPIHTVSLKPGSGMILLRANE
jgi:hypothetical protein